MILYFAAGLATCNAIDDLLAGRWLFAAIDIAIVVCALALARTEPKGRRTG